MLKGTALGRTIIYGAGKCGKKALDVIRRNTDCNSACKEVDVIAFCDSDVQKQGTIYEGFPVVKPSAIKCISYDSIVVAVIHKYYDEILSNLELLGVPKNKIIFIYDEYIFMDWFSDQRTKFIDGLAQWIADNGVSGSVAECGVNKGECARFINRAFKDRTLYLFDTFDGFNVQDLDIEDSLENMQWNRERFDSERAHFSYRDIDISYVINRMPYKEKIKIRKGIFPDSYVDINDSFCFVNIDMDLYNPTLQALNIFWNKVQKGGGILIHDYFDKSLGIEKAVKDFESEIGYQLIKYPIGDKCSIFVIKL